VLSNNNRGFILDTLQMFNNEIESNETPLNVLSLGAFYERNNLNLDALNQFMKHNLNQNLFNQNITMKSLL
jgi:hypothetical protein